VAVLVEARNSIMTPLKPASHLTEDPQFFAARLTEVAQRIDIPLDPSRPHLVHGEVRREIGINDDTGQGIGAFDNPCGGYQAYAVGEGVNANHRRGIVTLVLRRIDIQFRRLLQKAAVQDFAFFALGRETLRLDPRILGHPRGDERCQPADCRSGEGRQG
jgi:hypothetical protein